MGLLFLARIVSGQQARWITSADCKNDTNTWICMQKVERLKAKPKKAVARIAADSKYWLWINGKLVVREGGVKRGPNPNDTYYDNIVLTPYLRKGRNIISVLVWYYGRQGFSYKMSGQAGLFIDCTTDDGERIVTDNTWKARLHPAHYNTSAPLPNWRLPESNIGFDARRDIPEWERSAQTAWRNAIDKGGEGAAPWKRLHNRVIPLWKDFGLRNYVRTTLHRGSTHDTLVCLLPYDAQIMPWMEIASRLGGDTIQMMTDTYIIKGEYSIRGEYVTRKGNQQYENMGWISGNTVYYIVPKGTRIRRMKYRETGYDTEFAGRFSCSDNYWNTLWKKARRTLYVNMRDTYSDCPDRERAQWWGDEVYEGAQSFYALSPSSHLLMKKGIQELMGWQREDHTLYAPIPSGNWQNELPGQMPSAVGYYGFWNYYMNTGDLEPLRMAYPKVQAYLDTWQKVPDGTMTARQGSWYWGDWGTCIDKVALYNALYYLALKGQRNVALALGKEGDAAALNNRMEQLKEAFNRVFWTGAAYRHPDFKEGTDDRVQAMAVVAGLADRDKYPAIFHVLETNRHASPCIEKYVIEAYFKMGHPKEGLRRMRERYATMVNDPDHTTLYEGWTVEELGSSNHAWSGGGIMILSGLVCGVTPAEPGYGRWRVAPCPAGITEASATVPTVRGDIRVSYKETDEGMTLSVNAPKGTTGEIVIPQGYRDEEKTMKAGSAGHWKFYKINKR